MRTNFRLSPLVAAAVLAGCALNPATGQRELSLVSEAQEVQMGRAAADDVRQTLGFVEDADLQAYVARLGRQIAAASERPHLPWEFHVVDDPMPNAFALPGGFIYITRGMLNLLTSEAELVAILGHEVAHVTARHAASQISSQQLAQLGLGLGSIFFPAVDAASPALGAGLNLLFLKYSRDDEREADEVGYRYLDQHGYEAGEVADVFLALQRSQDPEDGGLPGWLSTHPAPPERIEAAEKRAAGQPGSRRVARDEYLRQIDGLVYGENPRHGFFRDGVFYHPDLQFEITFPAGWPRQNLPQAVVAAAPDRSAILELTLTGARDPEEAIRGFAAQGGVEVGAPSAATRAGGLAAPFAARTPQGEIRGVVAFARHGDRVYQIVGYAGAGRFQAVSRDLSAAIASFGPVTDPAVLDVRPERIDVVQVSRPQTLAEFAREQSPAIDVERLAVINHLPGPSARLEAGMLVKRVV